MAYINKREYQKIIDYAPKGVSKSDITKSLIAKGHTIQGVNDQEVKSFGGQLVKDIASPFIKGGQALATSLPVIGATLSGLPAALGVGDKDKARERIMSATEKAETGQKKQIKTIFGTYNPITNVKEAAGTAIEGASSFIGGGGLAKVGKAGIRGLLKQAVVQGTKRGAVTGSTFAVGRALGEDKGTSDTIQSGIIGGAGGAVSGGLLSGAITGGSLATRAIKKKISQRLQPVSEQVKQKVTYYIGKAIKPRIAGLSTNQIKNVQRKQIEGFQVIKNNLKDVILPDDYGGTTSRAPKNIQELVKAVDDVKVKLFSRYDKLAREAGDKGASFNPIKTIGELTKLTKDKGYSPSLRKYASEVLDEIAELKGESPVVIQSRIKELNESLAGYFAGRVEKGKARIDASVAKLLNEELDDIVFNFTAGDYKGLRSQFSALKSIEKDATRAAQRMLNRNNKSLMDFTDIFTGGDLMSGVLTLNPAQVARGVFSRGIKEWYKTINNPDRYIIKIFNELGETVEPQRLINRGLPLPSGKVSGAIPLSTPLKPKPLPKGKGEILKSTQKLDSLNPTGSVFAKYSPKQRATAELADNITTLDKTMGKSADEMITVYRGSSKGGEIVPGDFITTNKQLAKDYAGTGKVLEKKVKLSDVLDDIAEPLGEEYIYRPKTNLKSTPLVSKTDDLVKEAKKYKSADEFKRAYQAEHLMDLSDPDKHRFGRLLEDGVDEDTGKYMDAKYTADIYGSRGNNQYKYEREANLPDVKSPDELVTIYRGTVKEQKEMLPGDFVSFSREYALGHNNGEKLLVKRVPAKDVVFQGNDFMEWIYSPEKLRGGNKYIGGLTEIWNKANKKLKK